MAKALVVVNGLGTVSGDRSIDVLYSVAVDFSGVRGSATFSVDFTKSAATNIANFKTAVVAAIVAEGGPTLLSTDIIIWGGIL